MWACGNRNRASWDFGDAALICIPGPRRTSCLSPHWINPLWFPTVPTEPGLNGTGRPEEIWAGIPLCAKLECLLWCSQPHYSDDSPGPASSHHQLAKCIPWHDTTWILLQTAFPHLPPLELNEIADCWPRSPFSSLSSGLWDCLTSWFPPRTPSENVQWPSGFDFP